jgi:DNA-binding MarR family transcriptional regulator
MPSATAATLEPQQVQRLRQVIARLYRRLRVTDASERAGLTPARVSALLNVDRNGPMRVSRLAEEEGLNPTMLSRMVSELVAEGLFERASDAEDRRAAWVSVTTAGHQLAAMMREERTRAMSSALAGLEPSQVRAIESALPALEALGDRLAELGRAPVPEVWKALPEGQR